MRTRIKICGITRPEDGVAALTAGADYLGFILTESPRRLTLDQARTLRRALPPRRRWSASSRRSPRTPSRLRATS
jgi:phosphoribosylanthranilate isomerase